MPKVELTEAEVTLVTKAREREIFEAGYRMGLAAASAKAIAWGNECCGGSGEGGQGYHNLGASILRIDPKKGY